jgi:hypothetical protein
MTLQLMVTALHKKNALSSSRRKTSEIRLFRESKNENKVF